MNSSRTLAFATAIAISTVIGSLAPANAGQWSWLGNKPYIDCINLWSTGDFMIPRHYNAEQRAALKEKGRRYCNQKYYGHD